MLGKEPTNPPVDVQLGAVSLEDSEDDELQEMVRQRKQEQDELIQLRQLLALRDQELSVLRRAQEARSGPAQPMEVEETSKPGWWEKACGFEGVNCEDFPLIAVHRSRRRKGAKRSLTSWTTCTFSMHSSDVKDSLFPSCQDTQEFPQT